MDYGQSKTFQTHQVFSQKNIWGVENLKNVDQLPAKGFTFYNMPYFGRDGSGGPTRVIAIIDPVTSGTSIVKSNILFALLSFLYVLY